MTDIGIMVVCAVIIGVCCIILNRDRCRIVTDICILVMMAALCVELEHAIPIIGDWILRLRGRY